MFDKWIAISIAQLGMIFLSSFIVYVAILIYTRMVGLRSFSKMSAGDFAMTIAVVFETTGDVSVIHSTEKSPALSSCIFENVIGSERVKKNV